MHLWKLQNFDIHLTQDQFCQEARPTEISSERRPTDDKMTFKEPSQARGLIMKAQRRTIQSAPPYCARIGSASSSITGGRWVLSKRQMLWRRSCGNQAKNLRCRQAQPSGRFRYWGLCSRFCAYALWSSRKHVAVRFGSEFISAHQGQKLRQQQGKPRHLLMNPLPPGDGFHDSQFEWPSRGLPAI